MWGARRYVKARRSSSRITVTATRQHPDRVDAETPADAPAIGANARRALDGSSARGTARPARRPAAAPPPLPHTLSRFPWRPAPPRDAPSAGGLRIRCAGNGSARVSGPGWQSRSCRAPRRPRSSARPDVARRRPPAAGPPPLSSIFKTAGVSSRGLRKTPRLRQPLLARTPVAGRHRLDRASWGAAIDAVAERFPNSDARTPARSHGHTPDAYAARDDEQRLASRIVAAGGLHRPWPADELGVSATPARGTLGHAPSSGRECEEAAATRPRRPLRARRLRDCVLGLQSLRTSTPSCAR